MHPFDLKTIVFAKHAQHVVLIHFPIALFIIGVAFDFLAEWRKQRLLAAAAYYNFFAAALMTIPVLITGILAWQWQLEGAQLKGNLQLHLVCALTSAGLILGLCWKRWRLRQKDERPSVPYFVVMTLALIMITPYAPWGHG